MNVYGEEMILVKNSDGTYKIEVYNYPFEDLKTWFQGGVVMDEKIRGKRYLNNLIEDYCDMDIEDMIIQCKQSEIPNQERYISSIYKKKFDK